MRTLAVLLAALAYATVTQAQPGPVVFSELMWMGSSGSSADEWIELANRGDRPIDLEGWTITRASSGSEDIMLRLPAVTLAPGKVYLIANYRADDKRCMLAVTPDLVDPAVSLPNSKLSLRLYAGDPEEGAPLIDWADDGKGAPLAGDASAKHSMVRVDLAGDGSEASSWATADEASGWDPGAAEMGTPGTLPGKPSSDVATPTPPETAVRTVPWGQAKTQALAGS